MGKLDIEFRVEAALQSHLQAAIPTVPCTAGLTLEDFAIEETIGEGTFTACEQVDYSGETDNYEAKAVCGVYTLKKKTGRTPTTGLQLHRDRTNTLRETLMDTGLASDLSAPLNFTVLHVRFGGFRTYRTRNHLVSTVELVLVVAGVDL